MTLKSYVKEELKVGCDRTDITYFDGDDTVSVRTLQDFKMALEESSPGNSSSPAAVTFIVTVKERKPRNDVHSQVAVQAHTDMAADPEDNGEDNQLPQNRYGQSASAGTSPGCSGINTSRKRQLQLEELEGGLEVIDVDKEPHGQGQAASAQEQVKTLRFETKREELQQACEDVSKTHKKKFGVNCVFLTKDDGVVHCPYCEEELTNLMRCYKSQVIQCLPAHIDTMSHRAKVYALSTREDLNIDNFLDVELIEVNSRRILEAIAPGTFEILKDKDDKLIATCLICGPSSKRIHLVPKGSDLHSLATNHIESDAHKFSKKDGKQTRLTGFFNRSSDHKNKNTSHSQ